MNTSPTRPKRTPEEQRFLDEMKQYEGRELTVEEENLMIDSALSANVEARRRPMRPIQMTSPEPT